MSGNLWLDWLGMCISLANTILLVWLGLTVLLNAERRTWGAWVAGGGLLLGGIFFISHTAILGFGLEFASQGLDFWWYIGWVPVVALPYVWYLVILWYTGYWNDKNALLHRRQRAWFGATSGLTALLLGLLLFANPLPSYQQITELNISTAAAIGGIPILILLYPLYSITSIALALDALRRPGPADRVMGDKARQRARPWLSATSGALLAVSLLVAWAMFWIMENAGESRFLIRQATTVAWFDLVISMLIGAATITLGQAIVAYEIFTGKALPRRGFLRQWRRAIILAIGYGGMVSWSLNNALRPIYSLLLTALLMTFFYALLSWRSYTERERYIDNLRPFVASQGLFDQLLSRGSQIPPEINLQMPFDALCKNVLGVRIAYLAATGPLAPLVGPPLTYPANEAAELGALNQIDVISETPVPTCLPIDASLYGGASWAVPLWSERGQIGVLLLGEKHDGGLFTQEEIEIAQTSGERLIDTKASSEIAQRLMDLQRQRLAESQLIDQRTRRVLHDEVLQQLHTAMLKLVSEKSKPNGGTSEAIEMLAKAHGQISDLLREMPTTTLPEISQLGLVGALRKVVENELGIAFEEIRWRVTPEAERLAQDISSLTAEVVYYAAREAIRNAARHGRHDDMARPLHLQISIGSSDDELKMLIEDDGVGVSPELHPSEGGGQGLALHSTMMAVVGGELSVESQPGEYTRVSLTLPSGS
ncbi:MAG: ATP-binding protein [Anaerolineae bacterium]|nr:ATP-binding protein [Anaerolineae bacterium]